MGIQNIAMDRETQKRHENTHNFLDVSRLLIYRVKSHACLADRRPCVPEGAAYGFNRRSYGFNRPSRAVGAALHLLGHVFSPVELPGN